MAKLSDVDKWYIRHIFNLNTDIRSFPDLFSFRESVSSTSYTNYNGNFVYVADNSFRHSIRKYNILYF